MKRALSSLLVLGALGTALGCNSRAGEEYQGESLLRVSGTVVIDEPAVPGALIPSLAFYRTGENGGSFLDFHPVVVEGAFPASFTLDVYTPPSEEVLSTLGGEDGEGPRLALGYIAAVSPERPDTFEIPLGVGSSTCAGMDPSNPNLVGCAREESFCLSDNVSCYTEMSRCDDQAENCVVVETLGDPDLKRQIWKHVAGISANYVVLYLEGPVPREHGLSYMFNEGRPLAAGYTVLEVHRNTPAVQEEAVACARGAETSAIAEYNGVYGTDYETWADLPDNDAVQAEVLDRMHRIAREQRCPPSGGTIRAVAEGGTSGLSVEIGLEVDPLGVF